MNEPNNEPNNEPKHRWNHAYRTVALAVCPPAIRMFLVWASLDEDGTSYHASYPVIALQTQTSNVFTLRTAWDDYREAPLDPVKGGWNFEAQETECSGIILDPEYGLISTGSDLMSEHDAVKRFVLCPWPPDETRDRSAIDAVAEDLKRELLDRSKKK